MLVLLRIALGFSTEQHVQLT
uniref:Uncharacterized protein n=1 Tax=Ralstonia solanacearum TaxID=305 RepID=A0A0S4WFG0_RALSL|nr:protein of unknown function [Ralstonia solanacearum]CUV27008.1 protein of unknown function [Ralstonia solanacearum]CUV32671.1 protein of unknown function [Ralstonia solanacearum]CUV45413.1 protein of unknown function [Ralstonia solanacearum]CUV57554.1 protein of unknown function [Ralstonia solanacearum]